MYNIKGSIHDRYTLEFKIGYSRDSKEQEESDFKMDTWVFIPDVLGINQNTYSKEEFYRDFRTMVRVITPEFTLQQIADKEQLPYMRLKKWCDIIGTPTTAAKVKRHEQMYEHQIKTYCAIMRAAMRDGRRPSPQPSPSMGRVAALRGKGEVDERFGVQEEVDEYVGLIDRVLKHYRSMMEETTLKEASEDMKNIFRLGDEFLSRNALVMVFTTIDDYRKMVDLRTKKVVEFIERETAYEIEKGFMQPDLQDTVQNRAFLHRFSQLKKFVESDLWILAKAHSNTFIFQQFVLMLAAGLSMVWATIISFSFQQTFGNFTLPFFIALVISYMFKDRIKQLLQMWFATKLGSYMYEYKTKLAFSDEEIGESKYGMDFVHFHKLPAEVLRQRGNLSTLEAGTMRVKEKVIIFRQRLSIFSRRLDQLSHYPLHGINQIMRVNLREFLRRMDASFADVYTWDDTKKDFHTVMAEKVYYVHFIMRIRYQGKTEFKRYRVCLNRRGAVQLEEY